MELREHLYQNRNKLGIRDDVSYGDLVDLEDTVKKWYGEDKKNDNTDEDIIKLVDLSILMRILLEECKMSKLPLELSKRIDDVLKEIDYL